MGLKIEFKEGGVRTRSGTSKSTGKPWTIHEQEAWLVRKQPNGEPNPYPEKVVFIIDDPEHHHPFGEFELDVEASLYIGDFSALRLGRPVLRKLDHKHSLKAA